MSAPSSFSGGGSTPTSLLPSACTCSLPISLYQWRTFCVLAMSASRSTLPPLTRYAPSAFIVSLNMKTAAVVHTTSAWP